MTRRTPSLLSPVIVALLLAPFLVALSWPILNAIHERLSLPPAPLSGIVVLSVALAFAFVGGALIGHFVGVFSGRSARRGLEIAAVLLALFWGGFVALSAAPFYAGNVIDSMTRDGSAQVWTDRARLAALAREAANRIRQGESKQAAEIAAREAWSKGKDIALRGAATLPASLLLGWALLIPPILGFIGFKRAVRF